MSRIGKSIETLKKLMLVQDWGRGERGMNANGYRV